MGKLGKHSQCLSQVVFERNSINFSKLIINEFVVEIYV